MIAQRSNKAKFDAGGFDAVIYDIASIVRAINANQSTFITGIYHLVMPFDGTAEIYVTPTVTTTGSSGGTKHVVTALRNGQAETTLSANTSVSEFKAYKRVFLGSRKVGAQDVISLLLTTTGSPTACTLNNLVISIDLNPS